VKRLPIWRILSSVGVQNPYINVYFKQKQTSSLPSLDGGNINKEQPTSQPVRGAFTCHSCKQKTRDIWSLLEHVFVAHTFRICDEDLPSFSYPPPTSISTSSMVVGAIGFGGGGGGVIQAVDGSSRHQQKSSSVLSEMLGISEKGGGGAFFRQQHQQQPADDDSSMDVVVDVDGIDEDQQQQPAMATTASKTTATSFAYTSSTLLESLAAASANNLHHHQNHPSSSSSAALLFNNNTGHHRNTINKGLFICDFFQYTITILIFRKVIRCWQRRGTFWWRLLNKGQLLLGHVLLETAKRDCGESRGASGVVLP
jgi:hypothetical protein